jgi:hypothetical protein
LYCNQHNVSEARRSLLSNKQLRPAHQFMNCILID